jgi:hypothetical protein
MPQIEATGTAGMEKLERFMLRGYTVQEYYSLIVFIGIASIALVIIFFIILYLNRTPIKRWIRNSLNS